jgi:hypothetical protein
MPLVHPPELPIRSDRGSVVKRRLSVKCPHIEDRGGRLRETAAGQGVAEMVCIGIVGIGFMGINRFWFLSYFTNTVKHGT